MSTTDALRETPFNAAVFICQCCGRENTLVYADVLPLMAGEAGNCPSCGARVRLSDEELQALQQLMDRQARFGKVLLMSALPFFLIALALWFTVGSLTAGIWLGAGLLLFLLLKASSGGSVTLRLLPVADDDGNERDGADASPAP